MKKNMVKASLIVGALIALQVFFAAETRSQSTIDKKTEKRAEQKDEVIASWIVTLRVRYQKKRKWFFWRKRLVQGTELQNRTLTFFKRSKEIYVRDVHGEKDYLVDQSAGRYEFFLDAEKNLVPAHFILSSIKGEFQGKVWYDPPALRPPQFSVALLSTVAASVVWLCDHNPAHRADSPSEMESLTKKFDCKHWTVTVTPD